MSDINKIKSILAQVSKMYSSDPGIEYVLKALKDYGFEADVLNINGWYKNNNVPGEYIKDYTLGIDVGDGRQHHILVKLYADEGIWKVKEINAYMRDSLTQSSSKKALNKNIATEIKSGKDPKQAAAIAYSVQRENKDRAIKVSELKPGMKLKSGHIVKSITPKANGKYFDVTFEHGNDSRNVQGENRVELSDVRPDEFPNMSNAIKTEMNNLGMKYVKGGTTIFGNLAMVFYSISHYDKYNFKDKMIALDKALEKYTDTTFSGVLMADGTIELVVTIHS